MYSNVLQLNFFISFSVLISAYQNQKKILTEKKTVQSDTISITQKGLILFRTYTTYMYRIRTDKLVFLWVICEGPIVTQGYFELMRQLYLFALTFHNEDYTYIYEHLFTL